MHPMIGVASRRRRPVILPGGGGGSHPFITDKLAHAPNMSLPKPAKLVPYYDSVLNQRVTRLTDVATDIPGNYGIFPVYSTMAAWNSDATKLLCYSTGSAGAQWLIYNTSNWSLFKSLSSGSSPTFQPSDIEDVWWDPTSPDHLLYTTGSTLKRRNINTGGADTEVTTGTFTSSLSGGNDVMYCSWDGRYFGLRASASSGQAVVYDRTGNTFSAPISTSGTGLAAQVSALGTYFVASQVTGVGRLYDRATNTFIRNLNLNVDDHGCMTRDAAGNEYWAGVQFNGTYEGATLAVENLATGVVTVCIGDSNGWPYPRTGTHVSGVSLLAPGMVWVTSVGTAPYTTVLSQEGVAWDLNTMLLKGRMFHHHSVFGVGPASPYDYFSEPHPVGHPSGTSAIFGSNWGTTEIDLYLAEQVG